MSIAPTVGGVTAHYYSWRTTQYGLCVAAIIAFLLTLFLQPETAQPGTRGVDKLIEKEGKSRWVWLNPFGSIALLRSPNVLLIVSYTTFYEGDLHIFNIFNLSRCLKV